MKWIGESALLGVIAPIWCRHKKRSTRPQQPFSFRQKLWGVGEMFNHFKRDDHVKRRLWLSHGATIADGKSEVGRGVVRAGMLDRFGRDVDAKDVSRAGGEQRGAISRS